MEADIFSTPYLVILAVIVCPMLFRGSVMNA